MPYIDDKKLQEIKELTSRLLACLGKIDSHDYESVLPYPTYQDNFVGLVGEAMTPEQYREFAENQHQSQQQQQDIDKLIEIEQFTKNKNHELTFLKFTEQEILKMPKKFRKEFRVDGCTARVIARKSGKKGTCYEIRYRKNGYNVHASSTEIGTAKEKFIIALHNAENAKNKKIAIPTKTHDLMMLFFETYHIKKVIQKTYRGHFRQYEMYIQPFIGDTKIKDVTADDCEEILEDLLEQDKGRACEEVHSVMNQLFEFAIIHKAIEQNPLRLVVYNKHERETGKAISKADERILMAKIQKNCRLPFALLLYAGLRVNELYTAYRDGEFIVANNSKRKPNQRKELKRIAISPMLRPYLDKEFDSTKFFVPDTLREKLQKILPDHKLKDCRTTFSTRAQECNVNKAALSLFMGHSLKDMIAKHYSDFSDEFLISEAQKIIY